MKPKLLVIVGPTAVGKTKLSIQLAQAFKGEILSGDSMQVYRGMDIGTAKVSKEEQQQVPHHLIDLLEPHEPFSVQEYQALAQQAIEEITKRGHLPILVGGTGLYIDAVVYHYQMPHVPENQSLRAKYQKIAEVEGKEALHHLLKQVDPESAAKLHVQDVRRVIRALEVYEATGKPLSQLKGKGEPLYQAVWVGLHMPRELLYQRIHERVDQMIQAGLIKEVKVLRRKGFDPKRATSLQAIGYKEIFSYLDGKISLSEAIALIKKNTRHYAKRQLSWFRRNSDIQWFDVTRPEVFEEIQQFVAGKFLCFRE